MSPTELPDRPETIRAESPGDHDAVRALYGVTFPAQPSVPALVDDLRARPQAVEAESLVAVIGGAVVGHVMSTWSLLDAPDRTVDVAVLSPLAVLPDFEGRGIATRLIQAVVASASNRGLPLLFIEGDPAFYSKQGFEPATLLGFRRPSLRIPEPAFQVQRLPGFEASMTGTVVYSQTFWDHDCVGLRGEDLATAEQALSNG